MTNDQIIAQLLIMLTALIASQGFWNLIASRFTKTSKIERAIKALLHDRISWLSEKHIAAGKITSEDFRVINDLFEAYRDVGGNGTITRLMTAVQQLKIETKE